MRMSSDGTGVFRRVWVKVGLEATEALTQMGNASKHHPCVLSYRGYRSTSGMCALSSFLLIYNGKVLNICRAD